MSKKGRVAVITIGSKQESFGAMKLANWLRASDWIVEQKTEVSWPFDRFDLWAFSCVFSWKLPMLADEVRKAISLGGDIWIGGPAVTFDRTNAEWIERQTGIRPFVGIDQRFERQPGKYPGVYFSRGCPAYSPACGNCPVPRIEGTKFTFYPDAIPAPLLMDNNLSALPADYQEHIIRRYAADWHGKKVDANSGFEPHSFTVDTLKRWERFPLHFWRFGYDDLKERDEALAMMNLLKTHGHQGEKVRVYCMIGNEPIGACYQRVREIIDNGMHPWPQRLRPLSWREGPLPVQHDWTEPLLIAFQRFYGLRALWGYEQPGNYFYNGGYPLAGIAA